MRACAQSVGGTGGWCLSRDAEFRERARETKGKSAQVTTLSFTFAPQGRDGCDRVSIAWVLPLPKNMRPKW
jgi:hypothetical protein